METSFAIQMLGPILAVVMGYFMINTKLGDLCNSIKRLDEGQKNQEDRLSSEHNRHDEKLTNGINKFEDNVNKQFERHREDHQEHHKEIAKMFEGVSIALMTHVSEEKVSNALNEKEHVQTTKHLEKIHEKIKEIECLLEKTLK